MYTGTVQVVPCSGETGYAFGTEGSGQGQFQYPSGITVYHNRLFIADWGNNRIQVCYQVHMATTSTSTITPETTTTTMTATATTMMTTDMTVTTKQQQRRRRRRRRRQQQQQLLLLKLLQQQQQWKQQQVQLYIVVTGIYSWLFQTLFLTLHSD